MSGISFVFDLKDVKGKGFSDIVKVIRDRKIKMEDWRTPLRKIATQMYRAVMLNFRTQGARTPGGAWVPLSDVTLERRRKGRGSRSPRILQDSGLLMGSIIPEATDKMAKVGVNLPYAATMQFGARKGAIGKTKRGSPIPWGDIPARPYMVLNADDKKKIDKLGLRVLQGKD